MRHVHTPDKIITTGGGGMLIFQNEELAKKAKHQTTQSKVAHTWAFIHDKVGYNYRMPNINAALGLAQLEQIDIFLASKKKLAQQYAAFFKTQEIPFIIEPLYASSNYWLNCILLKDRTVRDAFLSFSHANGIISRPAWQLMNELPMFKQCQTDNLANAIFFSKTLVNIPSSVRNE